MHSNNAALFRESIHNLEFNYGGFAAIKSQAGLGMGLFGIIVNLKNPNTYFIDEGFAQRQQLIRLNRIAISKMAILVDDKIGESWKGRNNP